MKRFCVPGGLIFALALAASPLTGGKRIARVCNSGNDCSELAVEDGAVEFMSTGFLAGRRTVGHYVANDQHLVRKGEAPILDLKSGTGWHLVVTAGFFYGYSPIAPSLAAYLFDSHGTLWTRCNLHLRLESYSTGDLLGTGQEFFQITTAGEHTYVIGTSVWLLPYSGPPKLVVDAVGALDRIQTAAEERAPGLWIDTQTYDGVHSETKGWRLQFWRWDERNQRFEAVKSH